MGTASAVMDHAFADWHSRVVEKALGSVVTSTESEPEEYWFHNLLASCMGLNSVLLNSGPSGTSGCDIVRKRCCYNLI